MSQLDFNISTSGPHHVTQGRFMTFQALGAVVVGPDENVTPSITGLPRGATASFPNMLKFCCTTFLWSIGTPNPVRVVVAIDTPPGIYPLTITYTSGTPTNPTGVVRTVQHTLIVDAAPAPSFPPVYPADVPLPGLAQWEANMKTFGKLHCTSPAGGPAWEGAVWYYDGTRVYLQIADYTKDPSWNTCAAALDLLYSQYVLATPSGVQGYHVFPHGLAMSFLRNGTGTAQDKVALLSLLNNNVANFSNVAMVIDWMLSRDVSYALETHLAAESIGNPRHSNFQNVVEVLFGHFDQWFMSKTARYVQPFMVALACEALIGYWDATHDSRVPPLLQLAADELWSKSWDAASSSFLYYEEGKLPVASVDLNLLIVPLFGWVYQRTGMRVYRDRGDVIFKAGVDGSYLQGGKQFSQSYRWSGKYVEWRNAPVVAPPAPIPGPPTPTKVTLTINGVPTVVSLPLNIRIS